MEGEVPAACDPSSLVCLTRKQVDETNAAFRERDRLRASLEECRAKTPPPQTKGWDPPTVVAVTAGVVVLAVAVGLAAGYGLGRWDASRP